MEALTGHKLWHPLALEIIPHSLLIRAHADCCFLRANFESGPHRGAEYVTQYPYQRLFHYHLNLIDMAEARGEQVFFKWRMAAFRGLGMPYAADSFTEAEAFEHVQYPEHDITCLDSDLLFIFEHITKYKESVGVSRDRWWVMEVLKQNPLSVGQYQHMLNLVMLMQSIYSTQLYVIEHRGAVSGK